MTVFNVISLFGGLALFLYGMRLMGNGLKETSSGALKGAMEKVTNNPLVGFFLGLGVTAIIQSSTATIVLTSGLVGAGVITLHQSLGVIIGANVGTTITAQIIRLLDLDSGGGASWFDVFKPSTLAPLAAIIGIVLIMAVKTKHSGVAGQIAMGFGILFTGLMNMTAAVSPLSGSESFARTFVGLADTPVLGFLVGAGVAFLIQSSSATIGILQALSMTGALTFGPYVRANPLDAAFADQDDARIARRLGVPVFERAAVLTAIHLAAFCIKSGGGADASAPIAINADGSTYYKTRAVPFDATVRRELDDMLVRRRNIHYEIVPQIDDAPMIGAAIAAML